MGQSDLSLVKIEESKALFADSYDEVMDLQHMLLEPPLENDLSCDLMFTKPEDAKGCFVIEDLIHPIDGSDQKTNYEMFSDVTPVRKQELKCRSQLFADATSQGYGEDLFQLSNCASACPDFLPEFLLESHASQSILAGNCGPELQTQGRQGDCNEAEFLNLSNAFSTPCVPTPDEIIMFTDVCKFKYANDIGSTSGQDRYDNSSQRIKRHETFGLQNSSETEIYPNLFTCEEVFTCSLTSNDNDGQMSWTSNHIFEGLPIPFSSISDSSGSVDEGTETIYSSQEDTRMIYSSIEDEDVCGSLNVEDEKSAVAANKGQECVQRCNQETSQDSQLISTCNSGTLEVSYIANRSNLSCSKSMVRESKLGLLFHHEYPAWSVIQKPRNLRLRRSRPWRSPVILWNQAVCNEDKLSGSDSRPTHTSGHLKSYSQNVVSNFLVRSTKNVKSGSKRKQHRLWTVSEVMKLIEGVSQCGVGRWTEIKKLLFSTSATRTSVDLKDKWRNLLKASASQLQNKKKAESQRKNMLHHIPHSLLRRIRELSDVHPYTGDRKLRSLPSSGILTSAS